MSVAVAETGGVRGPVGETTGEVAPEAVPGTSRVLDAPADIQKSGMCRWEEFQRELVGKWERNVLFASTRNPRLKFGASASPTTRSKRPEMSARTTPRVGTEVWGRLLFDQKA
jgi:hypothetical protein